MRYLHVWAVGLISLHGGSLAPTGFGDLAVSAVVLGRVDGKWAHIYVGRDSWR